jgi:hypothetical protein
MFILAPSRGDPSQLAHTRRRDRRRGHSRNHRPSAGACLRLSWGVDADRSECMPLCRPRPESPELRRRHAGTVPEGV